MNDYRILQKKDGQQWTEHGSIYAANFKEAKKEFAHNMTKDNWELSNNIVWLDKKEGVEVTGWYDLSGYILIGQATPNGDSINYKDSEMELLCSEKDILKGFSIWSEDVYTWKLQNIYNALIDNEQHESVYADSKEEAIEELKEDYSTDKVLIL